MSLSVGVPLGNLGIGSVYRELREIVEGGLRYGAYLFTGDLLREPRGVKEYSGNGHLFPWVPRWETWERAHMVGAYVWKKVLGLVSPL